LPEGATDWIDPAFSPARFTVIARSEKDSDSYTPTEDEFLLDDLPYEYWEVRAEYKHSVLFVSRDYEYARVPHPALWEPASFWLTTLEEAALRRVGRGFPLSINIVSHNVVLTDVDGYAVGRPISCLIVPWEQAEAWQVALNKTARRRWRNRLEQLSLRCERLRFRM